MDTTKGDEFSDNVNAHLEKLHQIVKDSIEAESLLMKKLSHPDIENLTVGEKISDRVAQFGGSWKFIVIFFVTLAAWIIFNALSVGYYRFDPIPIY